MVHTKFYLDTRKMLKGSAGYSLRLNITKKRKTAAYPTGITLSEHQWDPAAAKVIKHPEALRLNAVLSRIKHEVDTEIIKLLDSGELYKFTATELRDHILRALRPEPVQVYEPERPASLLCDLFAKAGSLKSVATGRLYKSTANRIKAFVGEERWQQLRIEDINTPWLYDFDKFMSKSAPRKNSRAQHMRVLRAVCNYALDCEYTTGSPFRRFRIRTEHTRKRNFDIDTLRRIFAHQCDKQWEQRYLDMLKLIFFLRGINVVDLCHLTAIECGRIEYVRAKTHKPYSVKVEPEAMEIIEKYRGEKYLLNYLDNCKNYLNFFNCIRRGLRNIRRQLGLRELTTYWMRHSWATIAASIDIPDSIIAQGLGHGGNTVTDIYIERDPKKVDVANRRLLDWVLYGKL